MQQGTLITTSLTNAGTYSQSGGKSSLGAVRADQTDNLLELSGGEADVMSLMLGAKTAGPVNAVVRQTGGSLRRESGYLSTRPI